MITSIKQIIKSWIKYLFGIKIGNMEDQQKVNLKILELNREEAKKSNIAQPPSLLGLAMNPQSQVWQAIPGYFTLTGFDFNKGKGAPLFNANFGVPVKIFQNIKTGEMRVFSAYLFEK